MQDVSTAAGRILFPHRAGSVPATGRHGAAPLRIALSWLLALLGCGSGLTGPAVPEQLDAGPGSPIAIALVDVRLVPMDVEVVLPGHTVVVRDGTIAVVGPVGEVGIPDDAEIVEGGGRYLLPGLTDMHVHVRRADLPLYLAHGITTVRNMWGFPGLRAMAHETAAGTLAGPAIHSVSPGLDGSPPRWPYTQLVDDPSAADSVVQVQEDDGWRILKLYQDLSRAAYDSIVAAANRRGMGYVGHTPPAVGLDRVLEAGQRSIEHLGGYAAKLGGSAGGAAELWATADRAGMDDLAELTAASGAWNCPTLAVQSMLQASAAEGIREAAAENRRRMVRALHDAGAGLLLGTDAGIDVTAPGASLVTELREFVRAGLTPYEALRLATRGAAAYLGQEDRIGTIRAGHRADLVLVEENPLEVVGAVETPVGVIARGRWHARGALLAGGG